MTLTFSVSLESLRSTYRSFDARYILWSAEGEKQKQLIDIILSQDDPTPLIALSNPQSMLDALVLSIQKSSYSCTRALVSLYQERRPEEVVTTPNHDIPITILNDLVAALLGNDAPSILSSLSQVVSKVNDAPLIRLALPESHREAILGLLATSLVERDLKRYQLILELFLLDRYILGVDMLPYCIRNGKEWLQCYLDARLDITAPIVLQKGEGLPVSPLLYASPYHESFHLLLPLYEVEPVSLHILVRGMGGKRETIDLIFQQHDLDNLSGMLYCLCSLVAIMPYYLISGPPLFVYRLK